MGLFERMFGKGTERKKKYKFRNRQFYSEKPSDELKGVILLTVEGEAEEVAKSNVFIGTVEDTVGAWMNEIKKPVIAIGDKNTKKLFNAAKTGHKMAEYEIIALGVDVCQEKTKNEFPPEPIKENTYIVRAMPENEITGNCFLAVFTY